VDDNDQWLVQLRKGVMELIVLRLLARDGEMHGYGIVKALDAFGRFTAGEGTLYPMLKRLESDGLLASRWVEAAAGPPRKYYAVTDAGRAFLADAGTEWKALVETMSALEGDE
jgi:PadR family transcriptional regulator PadR